MSQRFVNIDRNTPMLLPVDLREWVSEDDLAHLIVDALSLMNLSSAVINQRGTGSEQYPPQMMLGVLIYCYAKGIFSSRDIESATYQNVSVRYLAGNTHPDHDTIATFRRRNGELMRSTFLELLQLAHFSGVLRVGTIAIDGTKLEASATKRKTLTYEKIQERIGKLNTTIEERLKQAEDEDEKGQGGEELPQELADAKTRRERLLAAKSLLEEQVKSRHEQREEERKKTVKGDKPRPRPKTPKSTDTINPTDPQSTLTPTATARFIQGYNAQVVVSVESGLIVAGDVVRDTNDIQQLQPMVEKTVENIGAPSTVLADSGYENIRQIMEVEKQHGCTVYCPPVKTANAGKGTKGVEGRWRQTRKAFRKKLRERLEKPAGKLLYSLRNMTVEPTIGILKSVMGFRRFHLRGLAKVRIEWTLLALAFNCRKLALL